MIFEWTLSCYIGILFMRYCLLFYYVLAEIVNKSLGLLLYILYYYINCYNWSCAKFSYVWTLQIYETLFL